MRAWFVVPLRRSAAVLNPYGMNCRMNREVYRTFPPGRSRWRLSGGGSSPHGRWRELFPMRSPRIFCKQWDPSAFPLPPRFPIPPRRIGSDIHRWAFSFSPFLFSDHFSSAGRAAHLITGRSGLVRGCCPAFRTETFPGRACARSYPAPPSSSSACARAAAPAHSLSRSTTGSPRRTGSIPSWHFRLLFKIRL